MEHGVVLLDGTLAVACSTAYSRRRSQACATDRSSAAASNGFSM